MNRGALAPSQYASLQRSVTRDLGHGGIAHRRVPRPPGRPPRRVANLGAS
ncbi:hypothetical protein [Lysobacter gummosus]